MKLLFLLLQQIKIHKFHFAPKKCLTLNDTITTTWCLH